MAKRKLMTDVVAMALVLVAIVTGFMLHNEVWHCRIYDDAALWTLHEVVGLALLAGVLMHCVQHSFWFKNYSRIQPSRKLVTTILLILVLTVAVSGVILLFGSRSEFVSHLHYVAAFAFTLLAIGHVAKRWKIFKSLF